MMQELPHDLAFLKDVVEITESSVVITDMPQFRKNVVKLVENSALGSGKVQGWSRFLVRIAAVQSGNLPASVHDLYLARGRGEAPMTWTTPAFNLRALSFEAARAMFRAAKKIDAGAFIFEIARSEIGYTGQRPAEYATNILAAAILEQFQGPVFLQGDHFQVSAKRYTSDPQAEIKAVKDLSVEALQAGFYNIDIDTSTLVDINKPTILDQQTLNFQLSAMFGAFIRAIEPKGVITSIGGEIGEVGGYNSTAEELRVFMDGYNAELSKQASGKPGLSKISIQTGTSHGGTVLADGSIAKVNLDFATLKNLSIIARNEYGLGGTVQHGASTLPEENFNQFVLHEAIEVHLATNFMNMFFDKIPSELRAEMYAWLDSNHGNERKPDQSDEQFYYKTRKNAIGPFKAQAYSLPEDEKVKLGAAWEDQFSKLFELLGVAGTSKQVAKFVEPVVIQPKLEDYVGGDSAEEDVSDLAD